MRRRRRPGRRVLHRAGGGRSGADHGHHLRRLAGGAGDARAAALASTAGYADGGVNAWIAEARRTLATSPEAAASVPDTVPVNEGVGIVHRACAAVAPDDTVGQAIPAYDYDAAHGGATAP